jgi:hypothetical protein
MRKIIRLDESDLIKIVKSVKQTLKEADGIVYNEIKGTTSSEPVKNVKVITDTGINATNQDFKGSWGVKDDTGNGSAIVTTFRNKSLSTFTLNNARPPYENYLEITVSKYKKTPAKGGNGNYYQLDQNATPLVTSIISKEKNPITKVFATRYQDPDDAQNYEWRISSIVGAGNGLLALSRAIKEGKGFPDKITIGFNQSERTSGGYKYDSAVIGNITPNLNAVTSIAAVSLFNKTNTGDLGLINKDSIKTRFIGKSDDVLSKEILYHLYSNDKKFIPAEDIERVKNTLTPYNAEPFKAILDKLTSNKTIQNFSWKIQNDPGSNPNLKKELDSLYGGLNEELRNEYVRQYKLRIKSFLSTKYSPEQAENMVEQINFSPIGSTIQSEYLAALKGTTYTPGSTPPKAAQKTTTNKYDLGSSAPKQ